MEALLADAECECSVTRAPNWNQHHATPETHGASIATLGSNDGHPLSGKPTNKIGLIR